MMTPIQLYSSFCDFIDTYIFSEEKVGMTVSFVVDKTLITEFCKKHNVTESILMEAVRVAKTEHSHPLGMVVSTHFRCGKGVKRGLKNGALPFNID